MVLLYLCYIHSVFLLYSLSVIVIPYSIVKILCSLHTAGDAKPKTKEEFTDSLKKACKTMDDLKRMMNLLDDKDRLKRAPSFRRSVRTTHREVRTVC